MLLTFSAMSCTVESLSGGSTPTTEWECLCRDTEVLGFRSSRSMVERMRTK